MNNFEDEILIDSESDSANETEAFLCEEENVRIDLLISNNCEITRSAASKLIENGFCKIDDKTIDKKSFKPKLNSKVVIELPKPILCEAKPEDISIEIVYEDDELLIVNKPQGMVVHPAPGNFDGTLVNALMYHCQGRLSSINGVIRPGIVHRIDKDTSGLLAVAKTDNAHLSLSEQIKKHSFKRVYNAIILGTMKELSGTIDLPIGRHPQNRKKMMVTDQNSRNAITHYKTLEQLKGFSLLEITLETGRTHQIRVHFSHLGHPVVGDPLYGASNGKNCFGLSGQALHAKTLGIVHPKTKNYMEFTSSIPEYFEKALTIIKKR